MADDGLGALPGSPGDELADGSRFLQPQTLGSILGGTLSIYFGRWWTVCLIYILPLVPIAAIHAALVDTGANGLAALVYFLMVMVSLLLGAALVVAISDICLGLRPTVRRCYQRAFASSKLITTYLLAFGVILGGIVLLVIPGMVFAAWYMFILPVLVLEQLSGWAALRRSRDLGRGCYWRNIGVYLVTSIVIYVLVWIIIVVLVLLAVFVLGSFGEFLARITGEVIGVAVMAPLISIPMILLYYDMRARKDNYGAVQLAEDLRI